MKSVAFQVIWDCVIEAGLVTHTDGSATDQLDRRMVCTRNPCTSVTHYAGFSFM